MSDSVARTEIRHGDKVILVSTTNRPSSGLGAYGRIYAETLVAELDIDGSWLGIVGQDEAPEGSTAGHERMVKWVENGMEHGDNEP